MDKIQLNHHLFKLTDIEISYKGENSTTKEGLIPPFEMVTSENGENIYLYTFENFHNLTLKSRSHTSPYLDDTKIEIVKHDRYFIPSVHIHTYIEMTYVYSGSTTAVINGEKRTLKKGDICILDPNTPHTILETGDDDILINFLMSKEYFSATMLNRLSNNNLIFNFLLDSISQTQKKHQYIIFHCQDSLTLHDIIENLLCEYLDSNLCSKDVINAYMVIIFSELFRAYQKQATNATKSNKQLYIGSILQYLEDNYADCTLQSVAKHFNFNPNYLSSYIKKNIGKNFKDLLQELRFSKACTLLKNTNLSIEEISHQIGYNNLGFFYQKFNSIYGKSPKEYRKEMSQL